MREMLRLLLCTLCLAAAFADVDMAPSKERMDYLARLLERSVKAKMERGQDRHDVYEEPNLAAFPMESEIVEFGRCPSGWAGNACKNPICDAKIEINAHDGTASTGETIEIAISDQCNDQFFFPIDSYLEDVYVYAFHSDESPIYLTLLDPKGQEVEAALHKINGKTSISQYRSLAQRGRFSVKMSSDSNKACIFQVYAKSTVVIDGGFVTDQHSDDIHAQAGGMGIDLNPVQGAPSYFAFKVSAVKYPAHPVSVKLFLDGRLENSPYNITRRFHCAAASMTAEQYTCDSVGASYYAKVIGVDSNGFFFQRVYDFECDASLVTPTGPTTTAAPTAPPSVCLNGGTLLNPGQNDAACYCGDLFRGQQCEEKICFNNGFMVGANCVCKNGFDGDHCLDVVCDAPSNGAFDLTSRALVYVVRGGSSMKNHIQRIYNAAKLTIGVFENGDGAGYFETYVLIEFNNHKIVQIATTRDSNEFLAAIQKIDVSTSNLCQDSTLDAVSMALQLHDVLKYPNSPIFVFSDGLPDDSEAVKLNLLNQLSYFRGQLNFIMLKDPAVGCVLDTAVPAYRGLRELAQFSQGIVARLDAEDLSANMLSLAFTSMNADYIHSNDFLESCNNAPAFQSIFIDESSERFYLLGSGDNLNFTVISPNRKVLQKSPVFTNKDLSIYAIQTTGSGNYLLSVNSPAGTPCLYRVFEGSKYDFFFSTSQGIFEDSYSVEPIYNEDLHVVARINNLPNSEKRHLQAEVMVWTNEGLQDKRRILFASSGIYRDSCDYNIYFGAWSCETRDMVFYITVFVNDGNGFLVQRTSTGICSAVIPPPVPPSGCLNGGVANPSTNGSCLCPPGYDGDKCQKIVCQNGGDAHTSGYCTCPAGFTGQFCEIASCYDYNMNADFLTNKRSMTFFVHDSVSTTRMITAMNDQVSKMVEDINNQHSQWINHWQLIRFSDTEFTVATDSDNPNAFIRGMKNILANNANANYTCMNLNILEPIYHAMQERSFTKGGFVFVFLDGIMKNDPANFDNVFEVAEYSANPITFVQVDRAPCGIPSTDSRIGMMSGLAQATGGDYIQVEPEEAGGVMLSIPSLYANNLIFEQNIADCASKPATFYFPIESQTQSFSVNVVGSLRADPVYSEPNDEYSLTAFEEVNFWNDRGHSRFDFLIRSCDDAFDAHGTQCYYTADQAMNWTDAQSVCHSMNAALVSVLSKDVQSYLNTIDGQTDYWLGLNDLAQVGSWEWDQWEGHQLQLSGYTNWGANQPSTSADKRCVFQQGSSSKTWIVDKCSAEKMFMCVKHPYDANYEPSDVTRVHLPRGMWTAQVQTWTGPCSVRIRAQSGIRLYAAYAKDLHDDFGYPELVSGEKARNFMVAHVTGFSSSNPNIPLGALQFAQMYASNMSMILAEPFYRRDNCAYDFITRPFACPSPAFQVAATGVDSFGYPFQRIISATCYGGITDKTCDNGGIFDASRGECICDPNFFGTRCEFRACQNGELGAAFECECYDGWSGQFCETPVCDKPGHNMNPFVSVVDKSFVVMLDGCHSGLQNDVLKNVDKLLSDVIGIAKRKEASWFTSFYGIVFRAPNSKVPLSKVISSNDSAAFVSEILKEITGNVDLCAGANGRAMMEAVAELMNEPQIAIRSQAFLIVNGFAADYGQARVAMDAIALTHTYVNVFVMGDNSAPGNGNYSSPQVRSMMRLAHDSGGSFYQLPDYARLNKLMTGDIGTLFNNYYMSTLFQQNCSNFNEFIQVGSTSSVLTVDIFAETTPVVNIADPSGTPVLPALVAMSKTNTVYLVKNDQMPPGLWRVGIDNNKANMGACVVNIRGVSSENVFVAFTQDVERDGGAHSNEITTFPSPSMPNAVLVTNSFGKSTYVQIFSNDERKLLWASPLILRSRCIYAYISRDTFECQAEKSFTVAVDGVDDNGNPFRRITTAHCG